MTDVIPTRIGRGPAGRLIAWGILALVLLAVLLAYLMVRLSNPATLVPLPIQGRGLIRHVWLDDQTLLCLRDVPAGRVEAIEVNLKSGKTNVVAGMGEALRGAGITNGLIGPDLSRDARWVLFGGLAGTNWHLLAVRTDGTTAQSLSLGGGPFGFCWLDQTQRWLSLEQVSNSTVATVHSVDSTQQGRFQTTLPQAVNPVGPLANGKVLCAWQHVMSNSTIILANLNPTNISIDGNPRLLTFPGQLEGNYADLQLSHGGDLLAGTATAANRVIGPVFSLLGLPAPTSTAIWISRTDGTQYREVGFVPSSAEVLEMHFTPDGQALTFLRRNQTNGVSLWRIPLRRAKP